MQINDKGTVLDILIDLFNNDALRKDAAEAVGKLGGKSLTRLLEILRTSNNKNLKLGAIEALRYLKDYSTEYLPVLIEILKNENNRYLKEEVIYLLGAIGEPASPSIPVLCDLIKTNDDLALDICENIARIGTDLAVDKLISLLEDNNEDIRIASANALGQMGEKASKSVYPLIKALGDKTLDVRYYAAYALGDVGKTAINAKSELIKLFNKTVNDEAGTMSVHDACEYALEKIKKHEKEF